MSTTINKAVRILKFGWIFCTKTHKGWLLHLDLLYHKFWFAQNFMPFNECSNMKISSSSHTDPYSIWSCYRSDILLSKISGSSGFCNFGKCYFRKYYISFFSFFLSGSRIESFLLMSFSSPTLAFTEYIEESWLYFQGHHQSQRLYISWYVSSVKNNLDFRIVFRYHDLLSLRTLKRKIHPNESLFSRYSLYLRGFWREKNIAFDV